MRTPYEERREHERRDPDADPGPGHEAAEEQLERWRKDWRDAFERDIEDNQ